MVGSSPHARGLHRLTLVNTEILRIIPARAGFTSQSPELISGRQDHPRTRGVYSANP